MTCGQRPWSVFPEHSHFQHCAARRRHLHAVRGPAGLDRNRNHVRDPFRNGVGAEDGMNPVRTGGHVADVERAVHVGLRRLTFGGTEKARPIGLQRQSRNGRRLVAALDDNFAFDASGRFHRPFDVFLARAPGSESRPAKSWRAAQSFPWRWT